jgi:hypothetical protein
MLYTNEQLKEAAHRAAELTNAVVDALIKRFPGEAIASEIVSATILTTTFELSHMLHNQQPPEDVKYTMSIPDPLNPDTIIDVNVNVKGLPR